MEVKHRSKRDVWERGNKRRSTHLVIDTEVFVDALGVSCFELFDLELGQLSILCVVSSNLPKEDSAQDQNDQESGHDA